MRPEDLQKKQSGADGINGTSPFLMGVFHLEAIAAPFFFTWNALLVAILLWWCLGAWGSAWVITGC